MSLLKSLGWRLGFAVRETGQALERAGCQLQGIYSHEESREWMGWVQGGCLCA